MKAFRLILGFCLGVPATAGFANITGSDLQNFNATTNGLDFVTVQSSETLGKGIFNLGLFTNYAVNTLPRYQDSQGRDAKVNDSIIAADFNVGLGLASFWDVGISIPSVIYQKVNFDGDRGQFDKNGITEVRANTKLRLLGDREGGIAFIFSTNLNVTENNPYVGAGGGPTFNFEFAFDTTFLSKIAVGANIGYRKRSPGDRVEGFPIEPLQDQYIGSLAASYLFTSIDTKLIFEFYSGMPTKKTETVQNRSSSAAEMLLGMKHDINDALAFHAGLGTEAGNGTASADWRIYTGLNYVFGGEKKAPRIALAAPKKKPTAASPAPAIPKFVEAPEPGPVEPPGEGDEVFVLRGINFVFDSASRVLPGTRDILANLGAHLKKNPIEKVIIEGHTDSVGQEKYNYDLGLARARTIREYLLRLEKLDPNAVEARSYGETRPVADNGNYQGRQLNRRVVFRIIYKK